MQFIDLKAQQQRIRNNIDKRIAAVLDHGQYIMGPEVAELETKLAEYVGVKHCVSVASGTDALMIAMMALGIGAGDEVITTPFTFIATGEMIALLGATPVFVDIDPATYNIAPALIEAAITDKTKAIMPVSLYGQCAEMDAINAIANKHQIAVIEDAAQSFGANYHGRHSCGLSTIGCTSFFPSKPLGGYGDGGACFTDDDELAKLMKSIRVHGQEQRYQHARIGVNGRFDTLQAAILLEKFVIFADEVKARAEIGRQYSTMLLDAGASFSGGEGNGTGIKVPFIADYNTSVYAQYTVQVDDREQVQAQLRERGIPTAVHYPKPLNKQVAMADCVRISGDLAISNWASDRVMSLPMHPYLTTEEQARVVEALVEVVGVSA